MLQGWSLLPDPRRMLATCREQSNELGLSSSGSRGSGAGSKAVAEGVEAEAMAAGDGQQETVPKDADRAPATEKDTAKPLPWRTWLAQKLYAQVHT
jgi:hypothetical protein